MLEARMAQPFNNFFKCEVRHTFTYFVELFYGSGQMAVHILEAIHKRNGK